MTRRDTGAARGHGLTDVKAIALAVFGRERQDHLIARAAGIAFWLLLAVFPAGLAAVNIAGLFTSQVYPARIIGELAEATPGSLGEILRVQLEIVAQDTPGSFWLDVVVVILAIWSVSTAMHQLLRGMEAAYGVAPHRSVILRTIAVLVAVGVIVGLGITAWILDASSLVGSLVGYLIVMVIVIVALTVMYWIAISGTQRLLEGLPGAAIAGVLLLIVGYGSSRYFDDATNLRITYGAISGIVASMLTVWLSVCVVLLGAAVNGVRMRPAAPATD